jgi:ABC-type cobalamin/Fe3+-siderophores transport system ATPase subunit
MPALSISALAKSFRAGTPGCSAAVRVLRDVHLTLACGELVAVVGPGSSGKTTLLRCAAGLLRPDAGIVRWFGDRTAPRGIVAYVHAHTSDRSGVGEGVLYARLEQAIMGGCQLLLVDDLPAVSAVERRLALALLRNEVARGACALLAADDALAADRCVSRSLALAHGTVGQRRNRSAARMSASSCDARPRASALSTYGLSLRSPQ